MKLSATGLLLALIPSFAFAGAWTQQTGALQLIQSNTGYSTEEYFDVKGKKRSQLPYQKGEASAYVEYGLYDDITLGGQIAFNVVRQDTALGSVVGYNLADSEIFARKRIWKDKLSVFSLQPSIILPSPDSKTDIPKIGADDASGALRAAYGRNFKLLDQWHYADLEVAYVHRLGDAADQWKLDATIGYNLNDTWQIKPQVFVTKSANKIQAARFTQSSADNYDLVKLQFSVQYALSKQAALEAGAFTHVAGKNTGGGNGIMLSWIRNF